MTKITINKEETVQPKQIDLKTVQLNVDDPMFKKVLEEQKNNILKEMQQQYEYNKSDFIAALGIFASILAFLIIEVQLYKTLNSWEKIVGFSLILWFLLITFNFLIIHFVKSNLQNSRSLLSYVHYWDRLFLALLFVIGVFFSYKGNEEKTRENKIYQKFYDDYDKRIEDLEVKYNQEFEKLKKDLNACKSKIQ